MLEGVQQLLSAWSVPFFAGWSILRIFRIFAILTALSVVVNYFYDRAGK